MGALPTPEDVIENRIPKLEDYNSAIGFIESELQRLHNEGLIYGGFIYGSTRRKEMRIGSDIDVLVLAYSVGDAAKHLREACLEVTSKHIPIEINPLISMNQAKTGYHGMEHLFRMYLKAMANETIGNDPFEAIADQPNKINPIKEYLKRQENALRLISRCSVNPLYSKDHCKSLSRMLNYTAFIPLDMHRLKEGKLPEDMRKPALAELYKKDFPHMNPQALDDAIRLWHDTNEALKKRDVEEYKNLLDWYTSKQDAVEEFFLQNIKLAESFLQHPPRF